MPKLINNAITLPLGSGVEAPSSAGSRQVSLVFQDTLWSRFRGTARRKRTENGTRRVWERLLGADDGLTDHGHTLGEVVILPFHLGTCLQTRSQEIFSNLKWDTVSWTHTE